MRQLLRFAVTSCCLAITGAVAASDCTGEGCTDEGCADSCSGDFALYERISLPQQPGSHRCVAVPEMKEVKKTVYATKWVPYCLPKAGCADCRRDGCRRPCPECERCVRWKKVVVKREVVVDRVCCYECVPEARYPACSPATDASGVPPTPSELPYAPPAPPPSRP